KRQLMTTNPSVWTDEYFHFDGLGRSIRNETVTPNGSVFVDTGYDAVGRPATVSNPYFTVSDPTYGITTTSYDAISRPTSILKPDGSASTIDYSQPTCPVATDEAGKKRKSCSDALGRLTGVWEDPSGMNYETDYQYDALGNLLRVDQKGSAPADSTKWRTRM